jgi:hypothetical protein
VAKGELMKKIYRKLFELCAWLGLPRLAMKFYYLSATYYSQAGGTTVASSNKDFGEWLSGLAETKDHQNSDDIEEFPF